ncbi:MAG TPA: autotransporter outer membrane beta-barrel domain-containing protein, partial [Afipia sp.]
MGGGPLGSGIATFAAMFGGQGNATTVNYGTVKGEVTTASGLAGTGTGNATLINYGTIDTTSARATGGGLVDTASFGKAAYVFNAGKIIGEVGAFGTSGGSVIFSNAGIIDGSYSGIAINLTQAVPFSNAADPTVPTTLNILHGSRILGSVLLNGIAGAPGSNPTTINIFGGRDISSVLSFGAFTGGCACGPPTYVGGLINTGAKVNIFGGVPYVISGNSVALLDPTSFAAQDRNVLDFTRTVLSAASSRLTSPVPISGDGSAAIGFAPSGNVARDMANDAFANIPALSDAGQDRVLRSNPNFTAADGTSVWAQGFGGVRVQNADGPNLRSVNQFYGGILGFDKMVRPDMRLGGFAGGGTVTSQIDMNSGRTNSDMGFGGIYGRYAMNKAFLDFALLAGGSSNNVKRTMTNNLAAGGYEYANANY